MTVLEELTELRLQRVRIGLWFEQNLPDGGHKDLAVEHLVMAFEEATKAIEGKTE